MPNAFDSLRESLRFDSAFWRQFMVAGIKYGPEFFVKYSPTLFGIGFGLGLPMTRRRIQASLEHVLGPRSPTQEALDVAAVFSNYAHCLTEAILVGTGRGFDVKPHVINVDFYDECIAEKRGVIIATAHTGGWDIAGSMLRRDREQKVVTVMARERDSQARKIQDEMRAKAGVEIIHIGESPLDALPLVNRLRDNAVVAMQIDRAPASMRARNVKLLDKPWRAPEGPLRLAATTGAPILPIFTRRLDFMKYEALLHPPLHLSRRPAPEELDAAAQRLMDDFGSFLKTNATQWFDFSREDPSTVTAAPP
ncbi:MAG TPA: lysophospholipid acyltransferase family protein [Polyangium sp.]|nr:lysophospholipid acyltransferase family protein [Polyangium sp.]